MPSDPHPARRPTLIAGASSGIGAATATALGRPRLPRWPSAPGGSIKCEALAEQIRAEGGETVALPLDVTDPTR